ncbi:DUF2336 domain-containing protein [Bradyrhizobium sp. JYMT SZCCT0428]|nr:DUF2336 domain-containing protein [Bradyrhizobium sp. JYMT SZCCT0428]
MVAAASQDSIAERTGAAKDESAQRDARILKQVAALFLSNVDRLRESQIAAFDGVLVPLIGRIEPATLVHLSEALSTTDLAPCETIRKLAFHDDPLVAAPVLRNSNRLSEADLVEIVKTRSQQHLLAISGRNTLSETLTDALMRLGDVNVSNALARNAGARFSECGYATLVGRAERDESLAEKLGLRLDIPANLLRELLTKATDIVRARFLTAPRPVVQARGTNAKPISAAPRKKIDYTQAQAEVLALNRSGKLNDSTVNRFAVRSEYVHVVAALSLLSEVKIEAIEPLIEPERLYGLIVACRASRLSWSTMTMIIRNRPGCAPPTQRELDQAHEVFDTLLLSVAQWTARFGADRMAAKKIDCAAAARQ